MLEYDKAVEKEEKTEFDLTPTQLKTARQFTKTGTRKVPTAYKFNKKERKPDATKEEIVAELAQFMNNNSQFSVEELEIINKTRQFAFKIGEDIYEVTLARKNKSKAKKSG